MTTPKLDRVAAFDERNRSYGVRQLIPTMVPRRKRVWRVRSTPLDQGSEGACVGFGWTAELAATPVIYPVDDRFAFTLYRLAQTEDRAMGNNFDGGASVLAGAKACVNQGYVKQYHWAFTVDEVIDAVIRKGPVVLGINWYESMYTTQPWPDGAHVVDVHGRLAGGHCIVANGYVPDYPGLGEVVVLTNSWGPGWGNGTGSALLRRADLERLLAEQGEACVATDVPPRRI
jgi:hypothetical protein